MQTDSGRVFSYFAAVIYCVVEAEQADDYLMPSIR